MSKTRWIAVSAFWVIAIATHPVAGHTILLSRGTAVVECDRIVATLEIAAAAEELPIDPPRVVPLGGDDVQPSELGHAIDEADVGASPRHVGRHGDAGAITSLRHHIRFRLVLPRVEHLVWEPGFREQGTQVLGGLHRSRSNQNRSPLSVQMVHTVDDRTPLRVRGHVYAMRGRPPS